MRFKELNPFMPSVSPYGLGIVYKGGGPAQTVDTIPDWYRPYIEKAAQEAGKAFDSGELSKVAGLNPKQTEALDRLGGAADRAEEAYAGATEATGVLSDVAQGRGIYGGGATQGLKDAAIRDSQAAFAPMGAQLASSGQVGGARAGLLAGERDANLASQLAGLDYQDLENRRGMSASAAQQIVGNTGAMAEAGAAGSRLLGEAGGMEQEQTQKEMDAGYQGLQRMAGLLSGAPQPGQQAVSGGK
jgi:hypothetical protein